MSVARGMWMCNGGVNSASDENWKEFSSLTISSVASFNGDGAEQALNVNKTYWQKEKKIGMQNIFKY